MPVSNFQIFKYAGHLSIQVFTWGGVNNCQILIIFLWNVGVNFFFSKFSNMPDTWPSESWHEEALTFPDQTRGRGVCSLFRTKFSTWKRQKDKETKRQKDKKTKRKKTKIQRDKKTKQCDSVKGCKKSFSDMAMDGRVSRIECTPFLGMAVD